MASMVEFPEPSSSITPAKALLTVLSLRQSETLCLLSIHDCCIILTDFLACRTVHRDQSQPQQPELRTCFRETAAGENEKCSLREDPELAAALMGSE